jgi:AcrR family transcriptional regulator
MVRVSGTTVRKNTKRLSGPERKRQIAEATLFLAEEYGIHAVTTAKIASRVGVSEAALYMHFDTREAMLGGAIDVLYEQDLDLVCDTKDSENMVEHFLRMSSLSASGAGLGRVLRLKLQLLGGPLSSPLREKMLQGESWRFDAHVRLIEQGKAEGSIRLDVGSTRCVWDLYYAYSTESIPAYMLGLSRDMRVEREDLVVRLLKDVATDPSQIERYVHRLDRERSL